MTTTASITSTAPLQVTVVTDQHMLELKGSVIVTVGADSVSVPYDQKSILHPVNVTDSAGHAWSVSDDQGVPQSKIVLSY